MGEEETVADVMVAVAGEASETVTSKVLSESKEEDSEVKENPEGDNIEENDESRMEITDSDAAEVKNSIEEKLVAQNDKEKEKTGDKDNQDMNVAIGNEEPGDKSSVEEACRSPEKGVDEEKEKLADGMVGKENIDDEGEVIGENEEISAKEDEKKAEIEEVHEKKEEEGEEVKEEDDREEECEEMKKDMKEEKEECEKVKEDEKIEQRGEDDEEMKDCEDGEEQEENQAMEKDQDDHEHEEENEVKDVKVEVKTKKSSNNPKGKTKGKSKVAKKSAGGKVVKKKGLPETNGLEEDDEIEDEEKKSVEDAKNVVPKKGVEESNKEQEEQDDDEEEDVDSEDETEEKRTIVDSKKRSRGKSVTEKKSSGKNPRKAKEMHEKSLEPKTPVIDRPQRERKTVERLVALVEKDASRDFKIGKGRGTPLKDIPNVSLKFSKRKIDDNLKLLHTILFGRRGKAAEVKSNILRFSGFVWHDNEEKHMDKVREKFDKCNKEKLSEFCDLFDLPVSKVSIRKEDLVAKLIQFLETPRASPTKGENIKDSQSSKRKRVERGSTSKSSSKNLMKRQKMAENSSKKSKKKHESDDDSDDVKDEEEDEEEDDNEAEETNKSKFDFMEEDNENSHNSDSEMDESSESKESDESDEESKETSAKYKRRSSLSAKKNSASNSRTKKTPTIKKSTPTQKRTPKMSLSKTNDIDVENKSAASKGSKKRTPTAAKKSSPIKAGANEKSGSKVLRPKEKKMHTKGKVKPSDDELRDAICEILKEVDFNTATFTDILKLLGKRFEMDLTARKSSIKMMIQTELTKFADEAEGDEEADRDEPQASKEVEV